MKIAVVGMGGVGGYYGGLLAGKYRSDAAVEIVFVARGKHLAAIRSEGLRLVHTTGEITAHPDLAVDDPADCGIFDIVFFCVKGYDLEQSAQTMAGTIGKETVLISLLNGVDNAERLRAALPAATALNGCVYISAHIAGPGVVRQIGGSCQLFFGGEEPGGYDGKGIEQILKQAGIDAVHTEDIEHIVWEKYLFIAPLAGATTFTGQTIRQVMEDTEARKLLENLLDELLGIAGARGLRFADTAREATIQKAYMFPPETKTSLQLDFEKGKRTELETFTGFVVREARRLGIAAPHHEKIYDALRIRQAHG